MNSRSISVDQQGLIEVKRWARLLPFLPTSHHQVKAYLKGRKYRLPRERKSRKETTNEEGLLNLIKQHPKDAALPLILRARHLKKGIGYLYDTYLGKDGRFHPTFTFIPDTGRLSSKAPNLQNIPQGRDGGIEAEVATAIRSAIIPSPGKLLLEFDWKAIESLLVGHFASDPGYQRIAKLGPHAFLASHVLASQGRIPEPASIDWPDEKLAPFLAAVKKMDALIYYRSKKKNHAGAYGQGARSLAKDMECSIAEAQVFIDAFNKMAPLVAKWQKDTRLTAHASGRLQNPFGYIRYFFEVFVFNKETGQWDLGKEANECLAFLPQSTGAGMLRETILRLAPLEQAWGFKMLVPVHDSILFEIEPSRLSEGAAKIKEVMEQPWSELGGLAVETDAKVGENWSEEGMSPLRVG